ncbi:MAG: tRNA (guanosine(37)-N1)-methyltransferase TrmD [Comamonadaceae bacterium]|nr:tRNA (guanosine(37)-N1)-methyltransferase TrmD [Comamonadaceae bacterium]
MRFDLITLFPELIAPFLQAGITRRAYSSGQVQVRIWNPRDFADGNYRRVDDRPFGGGPGMVMMAEPLARCLAAARADRGEAAGDPAGLAGSDDSADSVSPSTSADAEASASPGPAAGPPVAPAGGRVPVVLFSPIGAVLNHAAVARWAHSPAGAILICGRYEGIDQRFIDTHVTHQISLGDLVLSGGELAALALLDAVARLQPGVLGDEGSHQLDSFNPALDGLLDCPHYTRPEVWQGQSVPAPLLSGHHAHIERWRRDQRLSLTARHRPDLIAAARAAGRLSATDEAALARPSTTPNAAE